MRSKILLAIFILLLMSFAIFYFIRNIPIAQQPKQEIMQEEKPIAEPIIDREEVEPGLIETEDDLQDTEQELVQPEVFLDDLAVPPMFQADGEIIEVKTNSIIVAFSGLLLTQNTREVFVSKGTIIQQSETKTKEQYDQELKEYEKALKEFEESPDSVKLLTDKHGEPYYVFAKEGPDPPEDVIVTELKLSDLRVGDVVEVSAQSDIRSSDSFTAEMIELEDAE